MSFKANIKWFEHRWNDLSTKTSGKEIRTTQGGGRRKVFNGSNTGTFYDDAINWDYLLAESKIFFHLNHVRLQAQNQVKMSNTFLQAMRLLISTIPIGWLDDLQNNCIRLNSGIMKPSIDQQDISINMLEERIHNWGTTSSNKWNPCWYGERYMRCFDVSMI